LWKSEKGSGKGGKEKDREKKETGRKMVQGRKVKERGTGMFETLSQGPVHQLVNLNLQFNSNFL